ncbi:MAG: AraC family ligand binding domain-containing protein [Actinomycetales bacterium]
MTSTAPGTVVVDADIQPVVDGDVERRALVDPNWYAEPMLLNSLRLGATGAYRSAVGNAQHDEYWYLLEGAGRVTFGSGPQASTAAIAAGTAVQIPAGQPWELVTDQSTWLLSFLVPAPVTPYAQGLAKPVGQVVNVSALGQQDAQAATSDRQYEVLFDAKRGSRGATMFVGFIPTSGAPEHYHLYDEICVIVRGFGVLHTTERRQPIGVGSAFHVAPRLLHALENPNPEHLWVLGVFRPEGSAAAAYYPDGRPAPNNEE